RRLIRLAWPIVLSQLGSHLLGFVDTAVVGRLGELPLAAVGLGNAIYFLFAILATGTMFAFDPLVAQAIGAGEREGARRMFWQGLWLAGILTVPATLAILGADVVLLHSPLRPELVEETSRYLLARLPALLPQLLVVATRSYLQSQDITRPYLVSVVVANAVNLPLDWLFVFGDEGLIRLGLPAVGMPSFGAAGAGIVTTMSSLVQIAIVLRATQGLGVANVDSKRPDRAVLRAALRIGMPMGLTLAAEMGIFSTVSVLAGSMGTRAMAAHMVAITLAGTTFQVPLAIGMAAAVRVGQAVGAGDYLAARRAGLRPLGLGTTIMTACSVLFFAAPSTVARLLSDHPMVLESSRPLIFVAAVFQVFDGVQAVAVGALRGTGDTRAALWANLGGHTLIA
ncbi:MAG: MATE family efflux transporter, partial [Myxococcales bacterium]|nr:MATE family efflux transporter [Myxococcales bacterium]